MVSRRGSGHTGGVPPDTSPRPARLQGSTPETAVVIEALHALPAGHLEILSETVLRGRTVNQAAEVLGIPVAAVKSRVYYALRALRIVLAERGVRPAST
jgi:RNA polymerase sigma-70 factor, ECF subfamily